MVSVSLSVLCNNKTELVLSLFSPSVAGELIAELSHTNDVHKMLLGIVIAAAKSTPKLQF